MIPFPTLEQAFARGRKKATRQEIMKKGNEGESHIPTSIISRGQKNFDKSGLRCTQCGKTKHTKEQCFQLVGYPEWFKERRKERSNWQEKGRAAVALVVGPQQSQWMDTSNHNRASSRIQEEPSSSLEQANHQIKGLHAAGISKPMVEEASGNTTGSSNCNFTKEEEWVLDTGATDHMTYTEKDLINSKLPRKNGIFNANGVYYPISKAGDVTIYPNLILQNTLVVPSLSSKLISVGQLTRDLNCVVHIFSDYSTFQDIKTKRILGRGIRKGGLYYLSDMKTGDALLNINPTDVISFWHKRLGHPSLGYMEKLCLQLFINFNHENFVCETCLKAKIHRSTYLPSDNKKFVAFNLVHTDVWGPSLIVFKSGYRWYIIFVDDFSRMTWLYLLKTKEEVKEIFKILITMIRTQFEKNIKIIRSNNETEYINHEVQTIFQNEGIAHETSCVRTSQQNRVVEQKNRHILKITRALLIENNIPNNFWDNAVIFSIYLMNLTPTQINDF